MASSSEWRAYFATNNQNLRGIPWHLGGDLTDAEKAQIGKSVTEFQAGESSEGRHLLIYAREYSKKTGDAAYAEAITLFIAEEHRHARDLASFLKLNGIPLVRTTFTDRVFRILRNLLGGLEMSVAVLVTAEIIAKVYYLALRDATRSHVLRALCEQILWDEKAHVDFQTDQLRVLRAVRSRFFLWLTLALQKFLFFGTVLVVWIFHRKVALAAGMSFGRWRTLCWREFEDAFDQSKSPATLPAWPASI